MLLSSCLLEFRRRNDSVAILFTIKNICIRGSILEWKYIIEYLNCRETLLCLMCNIHMYTYIINSKLFNYYIKIF